jgi:nicotinamide mononucleotide (NMN) deamidase PncC
MPDPDPDLTRRAEAALARVAEAWLARPGVVSVEVARRRRDGAPTDEVGIRVTVEPGGKPGEAPAGAAFPDRLEGVPVDVVEGRPPAPES